MEQIKRLIEAVDGLRSIGVMAINQLSKTEESVIHALAAALPELRELVEPSRVGKKVGRNVLLATDIEAKPGDVVMYARENARIRRPVLVLGIDRSGIDPSYDYRPLAGDPKHLSGSLSGDPILATGVPLDAKTWPLERD